MGHLGASGAKCLGKTPESARKDRPAARERAERALLPRSRMTHRNDDRRLDPDALRARGRDLAGRGSEAARHAANRTQSWAHDARDTVRARPWLAATAAGAVAALAAAVWWRRRARHG